MLDSKIFKKLYSQFEKALHDYKMLEAGDKVMICLSGGKDSFTLLSLFNHLRVRMNYKFELLSFTLDQSQPGWDDNELRAWLKVREIPFEILTRDTYSIVKEKVPENKTYCSLCSRLRRGIIYRYASENSFTKIALGHHRDDLIETLLMSMFYNGQIKSMPPKLLSDTKEHIVIRPLVYCQEQDIARFALEQDFPIIPCNLCGSQDNLMRQRIKSLLAELSQENPNIPNNLLHALQSVQPSQLMDKKLWAFEKLRTSTES